MKKLFKARYKTIEKYLVGANQFRIQEGFQHEGLPIYRVHHRKGNAKSGSFLATEMETPGGCRLEILLHLHHQTQIRSFRRGLK